MRKGRLGVITAMIALAATTSALAAGGSRKLDLTGEIKDDTAASIKLVVVKKDRVPTTVKNVRVNDVTADCQNGPAQIDLSLSGKAPVDPETRKISKTFANEDSEILLQGKVKRDGTKVKGKITGDDIETGAQGRCDIPKIRFKAKKG
jgi:hypothetical protein